MKKDYLSPEVKTVVTGDLMQGPVIPLGSPTDVYEDAKEANEFIEEQEEPLPVDKNIWEDEEE